MTNELRDRWQAHQRLRTEYRDRAVARALIAELWPVRTRDMIQINIGGRRAA